MIRKNKETKEIKPKELQKLKIIIEIDCDTTVKSHGAVNTAVSGICSRMSIGEYNFNFSASNNGSGYSVKSIEG